MNVGKPEKVITVVPLKQPVPGVEREAPTPTPKESPVKVPAKEAA